MTLEIEKVEEVDGSTFGCGFVAAASLVKSSGLVYSTYVVVV